MKSGYKVRFRPSKSLTIPYHKTPVLLQTDSTGHNTKSKKGCKECRRRRVKCDETYPVCLRCQRSGAICRIEPPAQTWHVEMPGITIPRAAPDALSTLGSHIDRRLLQHWLEKTCQIMVLNPENNPLSYPILQLLGQSPWIASILQSISAAYENDFEPSSLIDCLKHRQRALTSFRHEITAVDSPLATTLVGTFLLGVSSCWIDGDVGCFGKEHLFGARVIVDMMLSQRKHELDDFERFALGTYIYWEMSCSLIVDPSEQKPLNTAAIHTAVKALGSEYHAMAGHAVDLFYLLATIGRHCRAVIDTGVCDPELEETLEEELLVWQSPTADGELSMFYEALRKHGLILLYRICGMPTYHNLDTTESNNKEDVIHQLALGGLKALMCTPIASSHFNMQPTALLTIASELTEDDIEEREEVLTRIGALRSINRTPVNLWAIQLLQEHWDLRSKGISESFVSLMLRKGWRLTMG